MVKNYNVVIGSLPGKQRAFSSLLNPFDVAFNRLVCMFFEVS